MGSITFGVSGMYVCGCHFKSDANCDISFVKIIFAKSKNVILCNSFCSVCFHIPDISIFTNSKLLNKKKREPKLASSQYRISGINT